MNVKKLVGLDDPSLPRAWHLAFLALQMVGANGGVIGTVKCTGSETIPAGSRKYYVACVE